MDAGVGSRVRELANTSWHTMRDTARQLRDRRAAWQRAQSPESIQPPRDAEPVQRLRETTVPTELPRQQRRDGADRGPELPPEPEPVDGKTAISAAEHVAAELSTPERPLGRPGRPLDRRSPFFVGMAGAAGVAVTYALLLVISAARDVLILIGLSGFLAVGLSPAVEWLVRRRFPRWAAVGVVLLALLALVGGFLAAAVPPLVEQATHFVQMLPTWWQRLQDHSSVLGQLNDRFKLEQRLTSTLNGDAGTLVQGLIGAGQVVFSALTSTLTVAILTIYFLADLPRIRRTLYRLVPGSRRPRAILIGDEIFTRIGGFVLGNLITSVITGLAVFVWAIATGIPYPVLLALFSALMDLVPVVGSTIAGVVVALLAWTVSFPMALITAGYIVVYRLVEDYLLVPRIIGKTVRVPAITTVVAVLIGGTLLGIIGALVAIPVAAVLGLVLEEILFPRLDRDRRAEDRSAEDRRAETTGQPQPTR